jgi:hypothetical protein
MMGNGSGSAVISPAVLHSNFLADIGRKDIDKILASARVKRVKAKQAIVTRGEHAQYLFILLGGRVRCTQNHAAR